MQMPFAPHDTITRMPTTKMVMSTAANEQGLHHWKASWEHELMTMLTIALMNMVMIFCQTDAI